MKQGASSISIAPGKSVTITFGALIHHDQAFDATDEYEVFKQLISK